MRLNRYLDGMVVKRNNTWSMVALLAAMLGGAGAMAQVDRQEKSVPPEPGVIAAAPDEEIFLDSEPVAPKPPKSPKALKPMKAPKGPVVVLKKERIKDGGLEQRMERLERMIEELTENLSEGDRIHRKNAPFEFQHQEFGKMQKEIERAERQADIAMRRFKGHPGMEHDFVFEHKIEIAGNAKMQRKALEAQRKALEKQLEVIDRRLESLEHSEERQNGDEWREEEKRELEIQTEQKDSQPSLPPE